MPMTRPLRVLVTPKDDNPYYDLLYGAVDAAEVVVTYVDGPTRSQTANLLLSPFGLAWYRARHYEVLHLHWLHKFTLPWARGHAAARWAMQRWFVAYLWVARHVGLRIVWTAHDLVPHEPIFLDDDRARSTLLRYCDLVVALSPASAAILVGAGARQVRVIPLGSYAARHAAATDRIAARTALGYGDGDFLVVWFGKVSAYKGVDLLLAAAHDLAATSPVRILVAGECTDEGERAALAAQVEAADGRAVAHFGRLADDELGVLLVAADLAAFPFREVTNSSSVVTALSFGLPVVVPALPTLRDLPETCVLRYEPEHEDLAAVLGHAATMAPDALAAMGAAGRAFTDATDWRCAARALVRGYRAVVDGR